MYHASRVERLVHIELASYAYEIPVCPNFSGYGAPGPHKEWFRIDPKVAIEVVKKWRKIMNAKPYEEFLNDSGGNPNNEADKEEDQDQNQQHDRESTPSRRARERSTTPRKGNKRVTERYRLKPLFRFNNETVSCTLPKALVPFDYSPRGDTWAVAISYTPKFR